MSRLSKLRLGLAIACIAGAALNQLTDPPVLLLAALAAGMGLAIMEIWGRMPCAGGRCDRE